VEQTRGEPAESVEAQFDSALDEMPSDERCTWTKLAALLDHDGRTAYERLPCSARDSVNRIIWWLSDPVWLIAGNERRAEHYGRAVLAVLRSGTNWSERWDMRDHGGGDAVREMIVRYGWPSFAWWSGRIDSEAHHRHYVASSADQIDHGRFATAEYSRPRYHPVPAWSAIADPWHSDGSEWDLGAPEDRGVSIGDILAGRSTRGGPVWWPVEHFESRGRPFIQLSHQEGLFRRDTAILFAMASDLVPADFEGVVNDTLHGALIFATGPDSMTAESRWGVTGHGNAFRAMVVSRPQMVGLELFGRHPRGVVARDRFGIDPPPTLAAMTPGEFAASRPVLLRPVPGGTDLPSDPDVILSRMFGSTQLENPTRVGVYWEIYGFAATDTVDVAIRVERLEDAPGLLRRVGIRLGIARQPDAGVTVGWREAGAGNAVWTMAGRIAIQGRARTVDISGLSAGSYNLVTTIQRANGSTATGSRRFSVIRTNPR
jgi:hypothetical protein